MNPADIKIWLQHNLGDASKAQPIVTKDNRVLQPYMAFNAAGVKAIILRDTSSKEYYAEIGGKEIGPLPATLAYDALLNEIAQCYSRTYTVI
jgi:hypothetical protein